MKKIFVLMLVAGILFAASTANAESWSDDFNDSVMDESLWWRVSNDPDLLPENQALNETGGVLRWDPSTSYSGGEHYGSTWTVGFDNDFMFRTDFYAPVATHSCEGESMVHMAMVRLDADDTPTLVSEIEAGWKNGSNPEYAFFGAVIGSAVEGVPVFWEEEVVREIEAGWIGMRYTVLTDLMEFGAFDLGEPDTGDAVWSTEYAGFTADFGDAPMHIAIGGWAEVGMSGAPMMYLDNFEGSVAPEPLSSVLFLVGGASIAFIRKRKKALETKGKKG